MVDSLAAGCTPMGGAEVGNVPARARSSPRAAAPRASEAREVCFALQGGRWWAPEAVEICIPIIIVHRVVLKIRRSALPNMVGLVL